MLPRANRLTLTLARIKLEADRQAAHRKMRGLDLNRKAKGIMETRGFGAKQKMILDQYRKEVLDIAVDRMLEENP